MTCPSKYASKLQAGSNSLSNHSRSHARHLRSLNAYLSSTELSDVQSYSHLPMTEGKLSVSIDLTKYCLIQYSNVARRR